MADVKETKEALKAVVVLGQFVASRLKDGAQVEDLVALFTKLAVDPEFKAVLDEGIKGLDKVPEEIKDISFAEVVELLALLPEILALLGKKA